MCDGKVYARTHGHEATHASFGPIKTLVAGLGYVWSGLLEPGTKLFGENMFGIHSIEYDGLTNFFYLFGVQRPSGEFASWDEVVEIADSIGVPTVPVLFSGVVRSLEELERLMVTAAGRPSGAGIRTLPEGFVVRRQAAFEEGEFERSVAKFVRRGHVQTDDSWLRTWQKAKLRK